MDAVTPRSGFGPSALLTPANALTLARLVLAVPFFALLARATSPSWALVAFWAVLCLSDLFDGVLARRQGATRSGAFLDPLADKVLVIGALVVLAGDGRFPWIPVVIIAAREVAISLYRSVAGLQGVSMPAAWLAKVKTAVQQLAVLLAIVPGLAEHPGLADTALWIGVVLTIVTGVQYAGAVGRARHAV